MRTRRVTETWEFYRDNCHCLKEPMRERFRQLDEYVAGLEELCTVLYQCTDAGKPCETCPLFDGDGGCMDEQRMDELGVPR